MNTKTRWILGGMAALAVAGLVYARPVLAAPGWGGMMHNGMTHNGMIGSGMMGRHAMMSGNMPAMHAQSMGEVSALLGMTADELTQAMSQGKTIAQLAAEKNVAVGEIRALMTRQMKSHLDQQVADNQLPQAQAAEMLSMMERNSAACMSGGGMMGGN